MALGTFEIPSNLNLPDQGSAELTSVTFPNESVSVLLHPDFAGAIMQWCTMNPDHPKLGRYGYLLLGTSSDVGVAVPTSDAERVALSRQQAAQRSSYQTMMSLSEAGRSCYLDTDLRLYFGWGLALEIADNDLQSWQKDKVEESLSYYGLTTTRKKFGDGENTVNTRYSGFWAIIPENAFPSTGSIEKVRYYGNVQLDAEGNTEGTGSPLFYVDKFDQFQSTATAELNRGIRAYANDKTVYSAVKELLHASMRQIQSLPDGTIAAFFPDRYGISGNGADVVIPKIEVKTLTSGYHGDKFKSHIYCSPVTMVGKNVDLRYSVGAVGIESDVDATTREAVYGSSGTEYLSEKPAKIFEGFIPSEILYGAKSYEFSPKYLYSRYGAQVGTASADFSAKIVQVGLQQEAGQNPRYVLPFLIALYGFMDAWGQFQTANATITFNPYVWPGCRVKFEGLGLSAFVKSVTHNMSYTGGFTTTISLEAPCGPLVGTIER